MIEPKNQRTLEMHQRVFCRYEEILKEYGPLAPNVYKKSIYQKLADEFQYNWQHIARIITNHFHGKKDRYSEDNCGER